MSLEILLEPLFWVYTRRSWVSRPLVESFQRLGDQQGVLEYQPLGHSPRVFLESLMSFSET